MEPSTWHLSDRKRDAMAGVALPCDCRHAEIITDTPTKAVSMRCRRSFAWHETMKHSAKQYVRDDVHTNSAEGYSCRKPVPFMLEHLQTCLDCDRGDLTYWAASDLNGEELEELAALTAEHGKVTAPLIVVRE